MEQDWLLHEQHRVLRGFRVHVHAREATGEVQASPQCLEMRVRDDVALQLNARAEFERWVVGACSEPPSPFAQLLRLGSPLRTRVVGRKPADPLGGYVGRKAVV